MFLAGVDKTIALVSVGDFLRFFSPMLASVLLAVEISLYQGKKGPSSTAVRVLCWYFAHNNSSHFLCLVVERLVARWSNRRPSVRRSVGRSVVAGGRV